MINIKKIISSTITLIILLIANLLLSKIFRVSFMELAFFTGLLFTIAIYFFSSEGGITTEIVDSSLKHLLEKDSRTNNHFVSFNVNTPFVVSLLYTIVSAFLSIIIYWKYF